MIEDNTSRWSGNHLMAPEVVPGILLTNRKLEGSGVAITTLRGLGYVLGTVDGH